MQHPLIETPFPAYAAASGPAGWAWEGLLFSLRNLEVSKPGPPEQKLLNRIELEVRRNQKVAIVGLSGSGKSLTLLSALRLLPAPFSVKGQSWYHPLNAAPVDLLSCSPGQLSAIRGRRIALMFQEPLTSLNPLLTCGFQIAEVIRQHFHKAKKEIREDVNYLLEQVRFDDPERVSRRYPHELSGGQRQRIMLAMALAGKPEMLIADEPTSALDCITQAEILELITDLTGRNRMALLFVTHDIHLAAGLADRILVFDRGFLVDSLKPADLQQATHPATRNLLNCLQPRTKVAARVLQKNQQADRLEVSQQEPSSAYSATADAAPALLQVSDLHVSYYASNFTPFRRKVDAVQGISFEIKAGESVGLAGVSGCGKTSVAMALLGFQDYWSGQVLFRQHPDAPFQSVTTGRVPKGIQLIAQDPYASLNPRYCVADMLGEAIRISEPGQPSDYYCRRIQEIMDGVQLPASALHRYPHAFSAGQRQRIAIARALATRPRLLLCDECVAALDVCSQATIIDLLNRLRKEQNLSYLIISHDLLVIRQLCDRVLFMLQGRIVEQMSVSELVYSGGDTYAQQLLRSVLHGSIFTQ